MTFSREAMNFDPASEADRIGCFLREQLAAWRREGVVVGLSGGVDSGLVVSLCVRALGQERVLGLILPERESSPVSREYAVKQAARLGVEARTVEITPALDAFGTYEKRDEAIREVYPEFGPGCRFKIVLPPDLLGRDAFNFFTLKVVDAKGKDHSFRLKKGALQKIVAASNTKQRLRMMHLYFYAERMNHLVCGTTNRTEHVQGFFVKHGDGGVDLEPIAHLYKTQVFALAEFLGVIPEIRQRVPSPDTFSLEVSDEEFFFRMPYETLDLLLFAWENGVPEDEVGAAMGLHADQVRRAFRDFAAKHAATRILREPAAVLPLTARPRAGKG